MDHEILAFLDESKKPVRDPRTGKVSGSGDYYVVAGAVIMRGDTDETRHALRELAVDLEVDVHYNELSRARRIVAIERVAALDTWDGYLFETAQSLVARHNPERRLRAKTMAAAFTTLGGAGGVMDLVLETRGKPSLGFTQLDEHDHRVLQRLRSRNEVPRTLSIRHETKQEPLLWLADVLAGARTDHLCGVHLDMYPRLAHRVREIHAVLPR